MMKRNRLKTTGRGGARTGAGRPRKAGALTESITVAFAPETVARIDEEVARVQAAAPPGATIERAGWVRVAVLRALARDWEEARLWRALLAAERCLRLARARTDEERESARRAKNDAERRLRARGLDPDDPCITPLGYSDGPPDGVDAVMVLRELEGKLTAEVPRG